MRNCIIKISWLYMALFFLLIVYLLKFTLLDSEDIVTNPYNPRLNRYDNSIKRGDITDSNGIILVHSEKNGNTYERIYDYPNEFSHVIGYVGNGKSGIESKYNFQLQNLDNEILQRIKSILFDAEPKANGISLTLDENIQSVAYDGLNGSKGAVVAIEPATGKLLAMVSFPDFNPNTISDDWDRLNESENSPLLNRATQGLYPPGSVFKIITAAAAYEHNPDYLSFEYNCRGRHNFGEKTIHCYNNAVHGKINIKKAFAESCNTFFSVVGTKIGADVLSKSAADALFNNSLNYPLNYNLSSFNLSASPSISELVETAIGQGKTLVTPLHIALITAAAANNGLMMKPYLVNYEFSYNGKITQKYMPQMNTQVFSAETAYAITEMMTEAVVSGTAVNAAIAGTDVAGKTGTAENASGKDHAWFVGFAPANNPQIAVAVIFENAGRGTKAIPLASEIMRKYLSTR